MISLGLTVPRIGWQGVNLGRFPSKTPRIFAAKSTGMVKEAPDYRPVGSGHAGRGRARRSERHTGLQEKGAARQRIGREAIGRERTRDRIVIVQRVEDVVDVQRPEKPVVFP